MGGVKFALLFGQFFLPYPVTSLLPRCSSVSLLCAVLAVLGLPLAAHADFSLSTIHTFTPLTDGNVTYPPLVQGADGKFYGVNSAGGRSSNGTIFSLNANGSGFTTLNTFTQSNQGTTPEGGIVQARDGNFYGTTYTGGSGGAGTLYQMIPSTGKLAILSTFTDSNPGGNPVGTLIEGIDGYLYGTARYGGTDNYGTIFRSTLAAGTTATLATVTGGLAGNYPQSDLTQGTDGNFYGTTELGGTSNLGTFFRVTPTGVYTVLYSFTGGTDGSRPLRGVVQGTNGYFYGVCNQGGSYSGGAIFRLTVSGATATVTPLYSFVPIVLDGSNPLGSLVEASDGNFYGTTAGGGANGNGIIYRITPSGAYNRLYSFTGGTDGSSPVAGLTQGSDGKLYGTTAGQNGSNGTIFSINAGLASPTPAPTYLLQTNASEGDTILIKGDHFVGTTSVTFVGANNTPVQAASFTVLSKTVLQVVVPTGAVTGSLTVTANGQTGVSPILTLATVTPPVVLPTLAVVAKTPIASKSDGAAGKFKITRTGTDKTAALTIKYKIAGTSTAILGTDYKLISQGATLTAKGTLTIPAGKGGVTVKVVPVQSSTPAPATTVSFVVRKSGAYVLGSPTRAVVQVTANGTGQ